MLTYYKHQFIPYDRVLELYFTGCHNGCKNCQNYFLQDKYCEGYREIDAVEIMLEIKDYKNIAKQVHILGGEPLEQDHVALIELCYMLKESGFKNIILFTGKNIDENTISKKNDLFKYVDFVKYGAYDERFPNIEKIADIKTGLILATTNQKIIEVK